MSVILNDRDVSAIVGTIKNVREKDISVYNDDFLKKTIIKRLEQTSCKTISSYSKLISESENESEYLCGSSKITYTQFFRDPVVFALLEQRIIPSLIYGNKNKSEIRVWSAGCSSGQEAYSLAMLLDECRLSQMKPVRYRIFASDISNEALNTAMSGMYRSEDVMNVKLRHMEKYFIEQGKIYKVKPELSQNTILALFISFRAA